MMPDLRTELIRPLTGAIMDQREEILRAFIAKYGCDPDEIEQIVTHGFTDLGIPMMTWVVRKKRT